MTRITVRLRSAVAVIARRVCYEANKRAIYTHEREKEKERMQGMIIFSVYGARARTTVSATLPSYQHYRRVEIRKNTNMFRCIDDSEISFNETNERANEQTNEMKDDI